MTRTSKRPPQGTFKGNNFMTPDFVEYRYRENLGGRTAWVEISEGTGMGGQPIYGVTFARSGGGDVAPYPANPSKCCFSLAEAREWADTATLPRMVTAPEWCASHGTSMAEMAEEQERAEREGRA